MRISLPSLSSTTAKRTKRLGRPRRGLPVTSSTYITCPSLRLWKRKPSWMLMLCLGIGPPETALLYVFKDCCDPTLQILGREPGDVGLFTEPRLLPLGEPARGL